LIYVVKSFASLGLCVLTGSLLADLLAMSEVVPELQEVADKKSTF
jgi:hypothetical protein